MVPGEREHSWSCWAHLYNYTCLFKGLFLKCTEEPPGTLAQTVRRKGPDRGELLRGPCGPRTEKGWGEVGQRA